MYPGEVPEELKCLSWLEELLIAKAHPVLTVYKTKGQQLHYSGQVINFPQDVISFSRNLPNLNAAKDFLLVVQKLGQNHQHVDFIVSSERV